LDIKNKFGYFFYVNQTNTTLFVQKELAKVSIDPNRLKPSDTSTSTNFFYFL